MRIRVNNTMDSYVISCPDYISLSQFLYAFRRVQPHYSDNKGIENVSDDEPVDIIIGNNGKVMKANKEVSCEIS